jgi:cell division protein FtsW (lipid II flippase)
MNFEFVSSVPLWYWIACILITFAAIIVGFYFVYLKQSKALTAIVNSADARSSGAGAQSTISDEAKWPVGKALTDYAC